MKKPYMYLKRFLGVLLSSVILILISPLLIIISIAIKIDSKGPILFRQKRTGYKGKEFELLKFRTMVHDNDVMNFKRGDTVTKVGKILRKTSLDELPQFINILKNDMAFIGPRPWITQYWPYYTERQKRRFDVKPGITGPAQASGRKGLTILERIEYDIHYVEKVSLLYDIKIVIKTIFVLFDHKANSYEKYTIEDEYMDLIKNRNIQK